MLSIKEYNKTYVEYYETFLTAAFGSESKQQPQSRYSSYLQFLLPWVKRDYLWQISFGMTVEQFTIAAENSITQLGLRYQNVLAQLLR